MEGMDVWADEPEEQESIQAEFVEAASAIRRAPDSAAGKPAARVSMDLERWLEVDRQFHELMTLIEVAIMQRDEAREEIAGIDAERELAAMRLREWKIYAGALERRLHEAQIENLQLSCAAKRTADIAAEALATPRFGRSRRRAELRGKLIEICDEL